MKKFSIRFFPLIILLSFLIILEAKSSNEGKKIFTDYCKFCHGAQGGIDGIFKNVFMRKPSRIKPNKFDLSDMRTILKRKIATRRGLRHFTSKISGDDTFREIQKYVSTGKSFAGRLLYKGSCSGCHGSSGDGNGVIVGFKKEPANLKEMVAEELFSLTKQSRAKLYFLERKVKHLRDVPSDDKLKSIIAYINSSGD